MIVVFIEEGKQMMEVKLESKNNKRYYSMR